MKPLQPEVLIERTRAILSRQENEHRKREIQSQIQTLQAELKSIESGCEIQPVLPIPPGTANERFLSRGTVTLDLHTRRVTIGERIVNLTPTAFDYLLVLVRHTPNVVDYQTMVTEAQGYKAEAREAQELVKWHVHHIRQAIETLDHRQAGNARAGYSASRHAVGRRCGCCKRGGGSRRGIIRRTGAG